MTAYESDDERNAAMRAWAKGIYPLEAGVELLARTDWGRKLDVSGYVEPSTEDDPPGRYAWPRVADFLMHAGYLSGGERRQFELIASLLGQRAEELEGPWKVSLNDALVGIDASFVRLFMRACAHTAGFHERFHTDVWGDAK